MQHKDLSSKAVREINIMVERVARKAGYTGSDGMTCKQIIQAKFEQKREKAGRKMKKHLHKFGFGKTDTDFTEEIKTYLRDGLVDLMNEGYSEEDALKITLEKFDEAELTDSFNEFVEAFDGFGLGPWQEITDWYSKNGEVIGLFYAAFTILGMTIGAYRLYKRPYMDGRCDRFRCRVVNRCEPGVAFSCLYSDIPKRR